MAGNRPLAPGDRFPLEAGRIPILDLEGSQRPLAELWRDRTVVLVFLRHFG